jgi:hypothetical protein
MNFTCASKKNENKKSRLNIRDEIKTRGTTLFNFKRNSLFQWLTPSILITVELRQTLLKFRLQLMDEFKTFKTPSRTKHGSL